MLSIGKLAAGQAKYYLEHAEGRFDAVDSIAGGIEDYYAAGRGEAQGTWLGAATRELGLDGGVTDADLRALLAGVDPRAGDPLRTSASPVRVAAFDLTFSSPKSVSVLFGLGGPEIRAAVRAAHDRAVGEALGYVERTAAGVRRGSAGKEVMPASGLVAAAFRHRTSRAGDPQLHTHVLVANLGRGPDMRWSALDGRQLYAHARAASFAYQAVLRGELSDRLGLEWTATRDGIAEIQGVPRNVMKAFSRRRAEIEASLAERGTDGPRAAEAAALATRHAKDRSVDARGLQLEWAERAVRFGFGPSALAAVVGRATARGLGGDERQRLIAELAGPEGLTAKRSSFTRRDVLEALCDRLPPGANVSVQELESIGDQLLASSLVIPLVGERDHDEAGTRFRRRDGRVLPVAREELRFSTPEFLALERGLIDRALKGRHAGVGITEPRELERALGARPTLSAEQEQMVRALAAGGAAVDVVVGHAGAGKTFALAACHDAWVASGLPVFGAAVARHAAQELQSQAGIPSTTVAALLAGLERGQALPPRVVLVLDEAGMADTLQLSAVLDHVQAVGGKLVMVGDDRQLPAIGAGGAFAGLVRRGVAVQLTENRRQTHAWEREAVEHLRAGRAEQALALYRAKDRLVVAASDEDARERLVSDWWQARDPDSSVMIALRRADVADLNARSRERMRDAGALGGTELELRGGRFATGDRVLIKQNDIPLGISNGERGVVTAIEPGSRRLELDVGGHQVTLDARFLDASTPRGDPTLTHGYAITGHAAQGITVDRAFVLADPALSREWGYMALTRGRHANHLYVAPARALAREEYAPRDPHPPDPVAALARSLSTSRAEPMALDAVPAGPKRDALAEARRDLDLLREKRSLAERIRGAAARRLGELESRRGGWRPRHRRELRAARAEESLARERVEGLSVRERELSSRVAALEVDERRNARTRPDVRARLLQRRLDRGIERDAGRGLEL